MAFSHPTHPRVTQTVRRRILRSQTPQRASSFRNPNVRRTTLSISAVLLVGMLLIAYSHRDEIRGAYLTDINSLATTNGTIVYSSISTTPNRDPWFGLWTFDLGYTYSIRYEFEVGDRTLRSDRITFGQREWDDPSPVESYVKEYPVGRVVTVFYDRNDPSFSVLEPDVRNERLIVLIAGIGLCAAIFVLMIGLEFAAAKANERQRYGGSLR